MSEPSPNQPPVLMPVSVDTLPSAAVTDIFISPSMTPSQHFLAERTALVGHADALQVDGGQVLHQVLGLFRVARTLSTLRMSAGRAELAPVSGEKHGTSVLRMSACLRCSAFPCS